MKARPVKRYRRPAYPTRLEVLADPRLLKENLPPRWLRPELVGAVAVFLAVNACVKVDVTETPLSPQAAIVAPIFAHGEGRGAIGCVVVSPPVFLSEEDALQVIREELRLAGVAVSDRDVELKGVEISQREEHWYQEGDDWVEEIREIPGSAAPLSVDLLDDEHRIAVEYVSESDYFALGGASSSSTVQGYALKDIAGEVAAVVEENGEGIYFGAFYDPMVTVDWESWSGESDWEEEWEKAENQAEQLLRQQVQDFVDWLKAQGVI